MTGDDALTQFSPGQRWLSEAEPDLGLGSVAKVEGRQISVYFSASGQRRIYAKQNAPLVRARFAVDDRIEDREGRALTVTAVEQRGDLLVYHAADSAGRPVELPEQQLSDRLRLSRPQDKLIARRLDSDAWFSLRYWSWLHSARLWRSPVFGLQGARIDLIPHQLYIAAEVASRPAPRVLLADEVGLGKTIEAGLILHRLMLTERVQRVLIVVPDALVNQWLIEMLRRFNLRFAIFDAERFEQGEGANPLHNEQLVLCTLSFLTSEPEVTKAVLAGEWDLLIVDEAHHIGWSEQDASLEYQVIERLAGQTGSTLLLTATPEQLGRAGHFGRLRLLDPVRFHEYQAFLDEERDYAPVAELAAALLDGNGLTTAQQALLQQLLGEESLSDPDALIARLIDRHGTGRVLFRNTRQAITGFPGRHLCAAALAMPDAYREAAALPQPEAAHPEKWVGFDPRVSWLRDCLARVAPEKVLLICAKASTAVSLRDTLMERYGVHAALFHEGMEIVARDRAAAYFADPDEGTQLLICSEIGSEGRNFQFAHHLVLFDLPVDPDLLEQRIGRLDRIGQRATIELHVPYLEGSAGEVLLRWYRDGLHSFEAICPAASAVYARLSDQLVDAFADHTKVDALIEEADRLTQELNRALEAGRDRLLELHSFDAVRAARWVSLLRPQDGDSAPAEVDEAQATLPLLSGFMANWWDAFGLEHEAGPGLSTVLRRGAHMLSDHYPGLLGEATTVTFDRADALAHEDRLFLSWEHPMVRGSLELVTSGELGSAAVTLCSHPAFKTGTVFFEALYLTEVTAPPGLELQRFLPPTCQRLLFDLHGKDHSEMIAHHELSGLCLSQNRKLADTVIKSQSARLRALLPIATQLAEQKGLRLVAEAREHMHRELVAERDRLIALSQVNPNVREDEIERITLREQALATCLEQARVRLDALRIVVMR